MSDVSQYGNDTDTALSFARELIDRGIPVFSCPPITASPGRFYLPGEWQNTVPDLAQIERWEPGWGLAMVCGHGIDVLDVDPRSGGDKSYQTMESAGHVPRVFGQSETPSGGWHYFISATDERKATGFLPGLDLQAGSLTPASDGTRGRGFVWLAPTIGASKVREEGRALRPYRWVDPLDLELWSEYRGSDDSVHELVARVHASRPRTAPEQGSEVFGAAPNSRFATASTLEQRLFTPAEARAFCRPYLDALRTAQIGVIEETANRAAVQLSHFVPNVWTADFALKLLEVCLAETAYDGRSGWTVEKFRAVLDGRRPPVDDWKADLRPESAPLVPVEAASTPESKADWLEAQLVTADAMALLPPPEPLIMNYLDLDSEAWLIGAPGSFKSFFALDWAGHVGRGLPWRGNRVRQGTVIYIAAEGARGMTLRTQAWVKQYGAMDNVLFLPLPIRVKSTDGQWAALVEVCRRRGPVLIIIDTQSRVAAGLEENSNSEMTEYVNAVTALRRATGACVLTIHHTGRSGTDARGASAIDGAQDTELKTVRAEPRSSMIVILKQDKQKDMAETEDGLEVRMESIPLGTDVNTGRVLSSLVLRPHDAYGAAEGYQATEVREDWELNWPTVQAHILKVLRDQGGTAGLTETAVKRVVAELWYGGKFGKASEGFLPHSTWTTAWSRVRDCTSASGDPVVVNVSGERWTLDAVALSSATPPEAFQKRT